MVVLWPVWMLYTRFYSAWKSAISSPETKFKIKGQTNEDLVASARAQIIEVAIESSFQPVLQLYLLLPILLMQFSCPTGDLLRLFSITDVYSNTYRIQFWSIVTSIISLSWSFTFYQSIQKKGALDFGSNPTGRITLFFSNLLQITSRLFALIIYAYTFGEGHFWPMILSVVVHILVMSTLHYLTSDEWTLDTFKDNKMKIGYHCLINGICNLYLHSWIARLTQHKLNTEKKRKREGTIFRQTLFDVIFVIENLVIVALAHLKLEEDLPLELLLFVVISQYIGIFLKCLYYFRLHVWKNTSSFQKAKQHLNISAKRCCNQKLAADEFEQCIMLEQNQHGHLYAKEVDKDMLFGAVNVLSSNLDNLASPSKDSVVNENSKTVEVYGNADTGHSLSENMEDNVVEAVEAVNLEYN